MSRSNSAASPSTSADAPSHERGGANTPAPSRSGRTDDRRFGAKPTGTSSPAAIVRFGLTRAQRLKVARREPAIMRELDKNYDRAIVDTIAALCDEVANAAWSRSAV